MRKLLLLLPLFILLTGFDSNRMMSPKTLVMDAANQDGQCVEVMGVVDAIIKVNGNWSFGYYYQIRLYIDGDQTLTVLAMTPQIPLHLIDGTLVKIKGKFFVSGQFDKHEYSNYVVADKIISLNAF